MADARDHQRHLLCHAGGLPVAADAERLATMGTIYRWFAVWRDDGRFERINHALVMADRERVGRDASPSAAILDSRSVKACCPDIIFVGLVTAQASSSRRPTRG